MGKETAEQARDICVEAYRRAAAAAERHGIIVADTKFELGFIDGELALCDEVLTPDSSRFWPADQWQPGTNPPVVRQAAGARLARGHRAGTRSRRRRRCRPRSWPATSERYVDRLRADQRAVALADWYGAAR